MIHHSIRKGFDLRLVGASERVFGDVPGPSLVAVTATDFAGIKPKLMVQEGDTVRTGDPLFFDKRDPDALYLAPATGRVENVVLGRRRALQRVEITPVEQDDFAEVPRLEAERLGGHSRDDLIGAIKQAGLWPMIRQRPIGRIADASRTPVAIFVNGMDTEPLAADPAFAVQGLGAELQAGVDLLRALTDGAVFLTVRPGAQPAELDKLQGIEVHAFDGPHPAGLVGTHLHAIRPLKTEERAWFLKAQEVALLGRWLLTGRYAFERVVAVAGSEAPQARYVRTRQGAVLTTLTGGQKVGDDVRVINGTVLNGTAMAPDGFLGFYAQTVTMIPEGEGRRDLFGWLLPQPNKPSASRAVWSWVKPKNAYPIDARVHGGKRHIVNIGLMESVTPLDVYPTYLMRAIEANDLEEAINLGLLEVTEEDVALCTFVDPCKIDVGEIVRQGLDLYEAEG